MRSRPDSLPFTTGPAPPRASVPPARAAAPLEPAAPAISLAGVVARRGGRVALQVDRLDLPAAAVTAVVGPNGSGKSTLLHVVAGLLPGVTGEVRVLGRPPAEVRRRVAYVLQVTAVGDHLPVTVREVVAMGRYGAPRPRTRALDHQAVDEAIERLELGGLARRYLDELSGGQRQRVLVAQGLAQRAEVLLLDEPLSGLDLASAERIAAIVAEERAAGRAVVVATHDLADAAGADRAVLLAGRVVAAGPPVDVVTREHLSKAYGDRLVRVADDLLIVDDGAHRGGGDHCGEHR
ncbi:MAG TPA: metal ABC transporter ATP-binding protein [Acidimicrobiales bacterium]|nr:metal ABC transporter ATP-binding protein [Acidimicrobiales bacterium]